MEANDNITNKELTQEFVHDTLEELKDEIVKEVKEEVTALRVNIDASKLLRVGLDQFGLKKNYWERGAWFAGGATATAVVRFVIDNIVM